MKGLIIADIKIIKMNDNTLKSGSSKLVPAALTASGTINEKWTNGVKTEEFRTLQEYIYKTIKDISKEILSGNIEPSPIAKLTEKESSECKFCKLNGFCGKEQARFGMARRCGGNVTAESFAKEEK